MQCKTYLVTDSQKNKFTKKKEFRDWNEAMSRIFDPELFYNRSNIFVKKLELKRLRYIIKFLNPITGDLILDVGCGSGKLSESIKSGRVIGIDISEYLLDKAKTRMEYLLKAEGETLPFKNGSFDKIVCSEVLEHVILPEKIIEEIQRVLKKDGVLIATIPNEENINLIKKIFMKIILCRNKSKCSYQMPAAMDKEWHLHSFSLDEFRKIVSNRFKISRIKCLPFRLFPLRYIIECSLM